MATIDDQLERLISMHPDGLQRAEIREALQRLGVLDVSDRTLSRRLTALHEAGRIRRVGTKRAARYYPLPGADAEQDIVLGTHARQVRDAIRLPVSRRQPVGYDESLLRDYVPGTTWYLAPAQRQALHEAGRVVDRDDPAGTFVRQIYERLLIDLAWSSSRLEGNTYSRLDTENLLRQGQLATGKDAREAQMILNHKKAIELLVDGAESIAFNRYTICNVHAALAENLLADSRDEGRVRQREVGITGTVFTPLSIPQRLENLFDLVLAKAAAIPDPFEQALFAMVHLPYLQPFIDVNKRTSRLAANIPFVRANLCPLSFVDVPEVLYVEATLGVYELRETVLLAELFTWAYLRSAARYRVVRDSIPEPDPIRLKYRNAMSLAIQDIVRALEHHPERFLTEQVLQDLAVAPDDRPAFIARTCDAIERLHEGVIARYSVRPGEFERWQSAK